MLGVRDYDLIPLHIRKTAQVDNLKSAAMLKNDFFISLSGCQVSTFEKK